MLAGILDHSTVRHVRNDEETDEAEVLLEAAYTFFKEQGVHLHSNYDEFLIMVHDDKPVGVAALAVYDDDEEPSIEFSVAVDPQHHRQGIARALIQRVLKVAKNYQTEIWGSDVKVEAHVINPVAMNPLLTSLDFEPLGGKDWALTLKS